MGSTSADAPAAMFARFAPQVEQRAPLYARLCRALGEHPEVAGLLRAAPPEQRTPVLLLAAVHYLVLTDPSTELAEWYPNLSPEARTDDPFPAFTDLCADRAGELNELLATRVTQTNEVGRCALLLPAFGLLEAEVGPLAHLDVGTSAGLTLNLDRYSYQYEPGGPVGTWTPVHLAAGTRGDVPIPPALPAIARRLGIDQHPVDVLDPEQARWLQACVWPDQLDRFQRLSAALEIARAAPVEVRRADAVDGLAAAVADVSAAGGHPVVTNSWVLSYLTPEQRVDYVAELDRLGSERDLSWVLAESPEACGGIPFGLEQRPDLAIAPDRTLLALVTWRGGRRVERPLAACHPHGYWLHWFGADGTHRRSGRGS